MKKSDEKTNVMRILDRLKVKYIIHGGCSPIGMKKQFKTIIDISANKFNKIFFSAGKIGYQIEISLIDLKKVINYNLADITVD